MILYARHAESTWNAAGRWQGQADPPLSARGRDQADALAGRLATHPAAGELALLAASPLARARETASRVAERLGCEVRGVPELRELDAGAWSGLTRAEVERRDPDALARFFAGDDRMRAGGGESREALRQRVRGALGDLVREAGGRPVCVVGHLGALRSLRPGIDLDNADFLELPLAWLDAAREATVPRAAAGAL